MKNGRNQRDVLSIERTLGLKSERGISRQSNKEAPPIEASLKGIKNIQTAYVHKSLDEIRDSQALKDDAGGLFDKYAPQIWPGPDEEQPPWLEEPSETRYDGRYPKRLHYTDAEDRENLRSAFVELVIEKCINFHENQLQKSRRQTAKQLNQQLQDNYEENGAHIDYSMYTLPDDSVYKHDEHDQDSGIGASPSAQPRISEKHKAFQEQFAAYTSPVPLVPHGLPSADGVNARPSSSHRLSAMNHHHVSLKRLPGQTRPQPPLKRARVIREDGTRADSLVVRLKLRPEWLTRLAQTESLTMNNTESLNATALRPNEQHPMHLGIHRAQGSLPLAANAYASPYRLTFPWNGELNGQQKGHNREVVVDLTMDDDETLPSMPTIRTILGEFADCDVAKELLQNYPNMSRDRLENLQSVLSEFPETRNDLFMLEKRIRALANGPRAVQASPRRASSASQSGIPEFGAKTPAVERTAKLAEEILGELSTCQAAHQVLASYPLMSREQLQVLRNTLTHYPETQNDFALLQKIIRFEAWDVVTGATTFPRKRYADGGQKYLSANGELKQESTPEPKREMSADIRKESPVGRSLDNIAVEINWGRDLDYSDHIELQEFESVKELFEQIDSCMPDELRDESQRIKEVRVKSKMDLYGGNIQPRIVRDETRGKAAVRHLTKKLRAQPPDMEIELAFSVFWEAKA